MASGRRGMPFNQHLEATVLIAGRVSEDTP